MSLTDELFQSESELSDLKRLFSQLKKRKPKNLDSVFHSAHENVFNKVDCLECANCCKTTSPIFRDVDVQRISKVFKVTPVEFEKQYLKKDEDGDLVLQQSPCTFLGSDNKCFIYDIRPQACREYPHTDRKRMVQILDITFKNTLICPAVNRIVTIVKKEYE